jgi:hypothetical protein
MAASRVNLHPPGDGGYDPQTSLAVVFAALLLLTGFITGLLFGRLGY